MNDSMTSILACASHPIWTLVFIFYCMQLTTVLQIEIKFINNIDILFYIRVQFNYPGLLRESEAVSRECRPSLENISSQFEIFIISVLFSAHHSSHTPRAQPQVNDLLFVMVYVSLFMTNLYQIESLILIECFAPIISFSNPLLRRAYARTNCCCSHVYGKCNRSAIILYDVHYNFDISSLR
jgi:hypothetical protein